MYTAALARMFVGVLPLALLMHMCVTCYMLGNGNILNIGFVRQVTTASVEGSVLGPLFSAAQSHPAE